MKMPFQSFNFFCISSLTEVFYPFQINKIDSSKLTAFTDLVVVKKKKVFDRVENIFPTMFSFIRPLPKGRGNQGLSHTKLRSVVKLGKNYRKHFTYEIYMHVLVFLDPIIPLRQDCVIYLWHQAPEIIMISAVKILQYNIGSKESTGPLLFTKLQVP